ncbi:hypothetical protein GCM10009841_13520 [Microlunatus panaciterrae]|uniref:Peptidase M14 domain-containing protein n=1 Tax=Microlunatus panaciterrae TaxID=400768 RepID=A0ABS2RN40_9ACTN|nr:M14 family zinc carboxypeptidase [Microlunatus panaciterrae]MBM7799912.1 hypothetical protein [Microlunatus panaciterrae]
MRRCIGARIGALLALVALSTAFVLLAPQQTAQAQPTQTRAVNYPRYGQRSAAVLSLQRKLVKARFLAARYRTGYYGTLTRAAVRRLQDRNRLKVTGRVDARTMVALDRAVAAQAPARTWYHRETIGYSAEGRKIVAYRAGQRGKPVVVVVATMHGEENLGHYVAQGLLRGRRIADVDLWVVPVINPDGYIRSRRWLAGGVDANRNYHDRFIVRAHSGPFAASAKETRVMMKFLDRVNPRYLVSWHQPLYGVDSYRVKDKALMRRLSNGLRLPIRRLDCHGSCHGTMTGWFNANHAGAAITVEYGYTARSVATMRGRDADALLKALGGRRV